MTRYYKVHHFHIIWKAIVKHWTPKFWISRIVHIILKLNLKFKKCSLNMLLLSTSYFMLVCLTLLLTSTWKTGQVIWKHSKSQIIPRLTPQKPQQTLTSPKTSPLQNPHLSNNSHLSKYHLYQNPCPQNTSLASKSLA